MSFDKRIKNLLIVIEVAALVIVCGAGAVAKARQLAGDKVEAVPAQSGADKAGKADAGAKSSRKKTTEKTTEEEKDPEEPEENVQETDAAEALTFSGQVQEKLNAMTLEQKVAQMFLVTPEDLTGVDGVQQAGEASKAAFQACPVGGLIYGGSNYVEQEQVRQLFQGFQNFSNEVTGVKLFSAVSEEGGEGRSPLASLGFYAEQPSQGSLGETKDSAQAGASAGAVAAGIISAGANMNLAPVADVAGGKDGDYDARTFGNDADIVSGMTEAQVSGYQGAGVSCALKYFPGQAYAEGGSDTALPANSRTLEEMEGNEFAAYRAGIAAGADVIIVGNMTAQAVTGDSTTPCSLSSKAVKLLREDMGYGGLLMTDRLGDARLVSQYGAGGAAIEAVKAGMDILYCPAEFSGTYQALVEAVKSGEVDETLINNAAGRILTVKMEE